MVDHGIIQWLVRLLSHLEAVPEAAVECCGALLMNLALSQLARQACQQVRLLQMQNGVLSCKAFGCNTAACLVAAVTILWASVHICTCGAAVFGSKQMHMLQYSYEMTLPVSW